MNIEISTETQVCLDTIRQDLLEYADKTQDKELIKKIENCSYDRLIYLMNAGYSEKELQNTLKGTITEYTLDDELSKEARELLLKLASEVIIKKTDRKMWKCKECGQIVLTEENPTKHFPKWKDGHKCNFEEVKDDKGTNNKTIT